MKKIMLIVAIGTLIACGSPEKEIALTDETTAETTEKIGEAQGANVELEEIDGELDSLMNAIK
jgi:hypothetical protein